MILDGYTKFENLIEELNSISEIKITFGGVSLHNGICIYGKNLPVSINEHEFNYMHDFILKNNLKLGYELATGTGISSLCSGIAFKKNKGKLITLDNYIEEEIQEQQISQNYEYSYNDSLSYNFIKKILDYYDLNEFVDLRIGTSPTDSIEIFKTLDNKIDYVFLDCPKCDEDFHRDLMSLNGYINKEKFVIFVHDTHTFTKKSFDLAKSFTGIDMKLIHEYYIDTPNYSNRYYPLGIITNIEYETI